MMEKTWIATTVFTTRIDDGRSLNGFASALNLSKLITAKVKDDDVERAVWNGHKSLHITLPNGHSWLSSSKAKSNGMLKAGVKRSHKAKFRIKRFGVVLIPLAPMITMATKLFPTQLNVKIATYSAILKTRNSMYSKVSLLLPARLVLFVDISKRRL